MKIALDVAGVEPVVNDTVNAELLPVTVNADGDAPAPLESVTCGGSPDPARATYVSVTTLQE
jgi:hypothetical protein